jgi:hypothetical protein
VFSLRYRLNSEIFLANFDFKGLNYNPLHSFENLKEREHKADPAIDGRVNSNGP